MVEKRGKWKGKRGEKTISLLERKNKYVLIGLKKGNEVLIDLRKNKYILIYF